MPIIFRQLRVEAKVSTVLYIQNGGEPLFRVGYILISPKDDVVF